MCLFLYGHYPGILMTGQKGTDTPKFCTPSLGDDRALTLLKQGCANSVVGLELAETRGNSDKSTPLCPYRSAPKGRQQMGRNRFLQKSAVFCGFLRISAVSCVSCVICANLRLPNPLIYRAIGDRERGGSNLRKLEGGVRIFNFRGSLN